jgi:L-Ala-D/L-Glu epimerase
VKISWQEYSLHLRHPFTIARGSRTTSPTVVLSLEHDGITGLGEAAPSPRYNETPDTVAGFLRSCAMEKYSDPFALDEILGDVARIAGGNTSAKAAIDIALHDWIGKKLRLPLWKFFGGTKSAVPVTSFTIGIDKPEAIGKKVEEAASYPVLKVKVGVPGDRDIIRAIRSVTAKSIRADANEGWKSREEARDTILWLEENGVEFVEQPMPASQIDDIAWLKQHVHMPLIADESVCSLADIPRLKGAFDGINIKLMKCTGLREAVKMIHTARATGLSVMLGCMIESSVGISAAAQISPLADYLDLDGNLLIDNDPFNGVTVENGKIVLGDLPGVGVK